MNFRNMNKETINYFEFDDAKRRKALITKHKKKAKTAVSRVRFSISSSSQSSMNVNVRKKSFAFKLSEELKRIVNLLFKNKYEKKRGEEFFSLELNPKRLLMIALYKINEIS